MHCFKSRIWTSFVFACSANFFSKMPIASQRILPLTLQYVSKWWLPIWIFFVNIFLFLFFTMRLRFRHYFFTRKWLWWSIIAPGRTWLLFRFCWIDSTSWLQIQNVLADCSNVGLLQCTAWFVMKFFWKTFGVCCWWLVCPLTVLATTKGSLSSPAHLDLTET